MLLIQALVTALLSGLFSGAIMFALNERRDRSNLHLNKIEATIESYSLWAELTKRWLMNHFDLFTQDDRASARLELEALWLTVGEAHNKARMLQAIYLPGEIEAFSMMLNAYKGFAGVSKDLKMASMNKKPMPDGLADTITETAIAVVNAVHGGSELLYIAARKHAHAPHLIRIPKLRLKFWKSA